MKPADSPAAPARAAASPLPAGSSWKQALFALLAGSWIGLSLLKFGNPVIFDQLIAVPGDAAELIFTPWPLSWGYLILGAVALAGLWAARPVSWRREHWPIACLGLWVFWNWLSSARSIDPALSGITMAHFLTCAISFLLGWWGLARVRHTLWFWAPLLVFFFGVLFSGFDQHHGGLESMRKAFYEQPDWQSFPKEYLLKMQSNRIFATLVYPNALAGVILFFLPVLVERLWHYSARWPRIARGVALGLYLYLGLACLYWTGSKGGWLIGMFLVGVILLLSSIPRKVKTVLVVAGVVLGLTVFFVRFSPYFQKGATSVSARFIYWKAAVQTAAAHPVLGTGPGTFSAAFRKVKPPEAEMTKLTHNDYLEQASDSGLIGFLAYSGFILGSLWVLYRQRNVLGWESALVWVGVLGGAVQGLIEFGLYIPALAWPQFLMIGWLWGVSDRANPVKDNDKVIKKH